MTARRIAQVFVVSIFAFAALFVAWALWHQSRHNALLVELGDRGVEVQGRVVRKHKSNPSPGSSARVSYVLDVEHSYQGRRYTNSYAVSSGEYQDLAVGHSIALLILPDEPKVGQRAEVVRGHADFSGFIPVER
jgi:hypothetical protein